MKRLAIYNSTTGTFTPLTDRVYLINLDVLEEKNPDALDRLQNGEVGVPVRDHIGWEVDNYNMTNLFYGQPE